jgi:hypothetical protein
MPVDAATTSSLLTRPAASAIAFWSAALSPAGGLPSSTSEA